VFVNPGTAGLGLASAVELAKKGAHVIITARSAARGEQVLKDIARQVGALGGGGAGENFISSFTEGTGTIEFGVCQVPVCACVYVWCVCVSRHMCTKKSMPLVNLIHLYMCVSSQHI